MCTCNCSETKKFLWKNNVEEFFWLCNFSFLFETSSVWSDLGTHILHGYLEWAHLEAHLIDFQTINDFIFNLLCKMLEI